MARRARSAVSAANQAAREALLAASNGAANGNADPNHLGDLAWWDPVSGWRRPVSEVHDVFRKHGFDPDAILPASPDWSTAFGRAVTYIKGALTKRDYTLIDAAAGPSGERRVAIVRIARKGEVSTADEGTVTCPKDGAAPFIERRDPNGICDEILASARSYFGVYISQDLVSTVTETFERWGALPCRQRLPFIVYWAPPTAGDVVRRLSDACEEAGWGRIELFAGYKSDPRSARACVNAVNDGLEAKLKAFAEEVSIYAEADPSKTRAKTIEAKLESAKVLRAKGALYREILGAAVSSIDDRMGAIEDSLRKTLGLVDAAHETAKGKAA